MDTSFTPNSRGLLADRVLWTPGARTEEITLADEAQYDLHGQRQSGSVLIASKSNMPFVGRYRIELSDAGLGVSNRLYTEFEVFMPRTVVSTAFAVVSNVLTVTVLIGHEVAVDQWIVITGFAGLVPAGKGVALQVTAVTATTIVMALTTANDSATEAGAVHYQPISQSATPWVNLYDGITVNDIVIALGASFAGQYRVSMFGDAVDEKTALYHSDGTEMVLQTFTHIDADDEDSAVEDFDDADTDGETNLTIDTGVVNLRNRNAIASRITVEFKPYIFTSHDDNTFACFFEKDGQIILKNRLGATHEFAIENIGPSRSNRIASVDPNQRITDLLGPIS